jgi:hypothetical protein
VLTARHLRASSGAYQRFRGAAWAHRRQQQAWRGGSGQRRIRRKITRGGMVASKTSSAVNKRFAARIRLAYRACWRLRSTLNAATPRHAESISVLPRAHRTLRYAQCTLRDIMRRGLAGARRQRA